MRLATVQWNTVPSAPGPSGSRGIPSEPGLWPIDPKVEVTDLAELSDFGSIREIRQHVERRLTENVVTRLQQVLSFLEDHRVDLAVFPEYAVPCNSETLSVLNGFTKRMVVVVGLGVPRQNGYNDLQTYTDDEVSHEDNVTAIFSSSGCQLVTKRHAAEGERISVGDGPRIVEVNIGGAVRKLGVAVCKDFLFEGPNIARFENSPDILAIPAYSGKTAPFAADGRDFVRIFANGAEGGGSTIFASGCQGTFVNDDGKIAPIPPGNKGV